MPQMLPHADPGTVNDEHVATVSSAPVEIDPGLVMTCCANCGAQMIDRKCKMICECGYFLSCSDYY